MEKSRNCLHYQGFRHPKGDVENKKGFEQVSTGIILSTVYFAHYTGLVDKNEEIKINGFGWSFSDPPRQRVRNHRW